MSTAARLVFISTRFLFPVDTGGKIRTTQVLRGMKEAGDYHITLLSPATAGERDRYRADLESVCDEFDGWPRSDRGRLFHYGRLIHLLDHRPVPVRTDYDPRALALIERHLARRPDVAVYDFVHAAVLMPRDPGVPTVMFTHNVETEIFERHRQKAGGAARRWLWTDQSRKMAAFESANLKRYDRVVAVSERDGETFQTRFGVDPARCHVIPTGVDLEFFSYAAPDRERDVVFCGSMDWMANQDAMTWYLAEIWPRVAAEIPGARMTVIGRNPPRSLLDQAASLPGVRFTGFVDDIREHAHGAAVSVIPIRVGGGTRLKAYEAMALGNPMVSTTVGVEGLPIAAGEHYLRADDAPGFADAVIGLLRDGERRRRIAEAARACVEANFSYRVAARSFQDACDAAREARHAGT